MTTVPGAAAEAVAAGAATAVPASVEFRASEGVRIAATDWEGRAASVRQSLLEEGLLESSLTEALTSFRFLDDGARIWSYDGTTWWVWDGQRWGAGAAPASLALQPFSLDLLPDVGDEPPAGVAPLLDAPEELPAAEEIAAASVPPEPYSIPDAVGPMPPSIEVPAAVPATPGSALPAMLPPPAPVTPPPAPVTPRPVPLTAPSPGVAPKPSGPTYRPTHLAPPSGLPAWSRPDPTVAADHRLDPGLDVMVAEAFPNGWARIVCSNGWSGWVDGRYLVPVGQAMSLVGTTAASSPYLPSGWVATSAAAKAPGLNLRSEIGLVALLAIVSWVVAAFVAPFGVLIAILQQPWLAGAAIAIVPLAIKVQRRGQPGPRDAVMFVLDTAVAAIIFILLSPG